jgi:hypothetical protein
LIASTDSICQAVVRQSSGSCQAVVRQSSGSRGSRQAVVRQSSGSRQAVVRQSSGSRQAVKWQSRNEVYLQGLKSGVYCTNFVFIWFYLLLQYRTGFETFLDIYVISCECLNVKVYDPSFDMDSCLKLLRTIMVVNVLGISCQIEFQ